MTSARQSGATIPSSVQSKQASNVLRKYSSTLTIASTTANVVADKGVSYRILGLASCGTVFEALGIEFAVKKGRYTKAP